MIMTCSKARTEGGLEGIVFLYFIPQESLPDNAALDYMYVVYMI